MNAPYISKLSYTHYSKEKYLTAFLLGFFVLLISIAPVMIADRGYFIYYGDYNAQQIPFYNLSNDAVRSGQFGWNWFTDLGSDWLTSYSFYLSASPFFWLSVLLPRGLVTYAMPILLAMKHGLASLTAYIYIRRFVRSKSASLVGGLLYAFSGFQIFNIFFNHFQDVTAFFPLMLIAMEENINNRRRGWFALIVAAMACINYYFFTGEAVFLVIYFLVRVPCKDFRVSWLKFFGLLFEAVVGTAIACFILYPSALAILGNYRVSERLYGTDLVLYKEPSRVLRIIQTFFMPSDAPARPNLFKNDEAKWSSVGGYLPMFGMTGVITFARMKKKHWAVKITVICAVCSFFPLLNSMFYAFNAAYYARWFFMPILILAMMTAQTLDDEDADIKPAVKISALMLVFFGVIALLPTKEDNGFALLDITYDFLYFCIQMLAAVLCLVFASFIFKRRRKGRPCGKLAVVSTAFASLICTMCVVIYGACSPKAAGEYIDYGINGKDGVFREVSTDDFFRIDISENCDNYPMMWGLPSIRAFQSVVSPSIMEFYDAIGIKRDVASRPDVSHYTLRGLLSVKYFYREIQEGYEYMDVAGKDQKGSPEISGKYGINASKADITQYLYGFDYLGTGKHFELYENELFVPMGFGYDIYISENEAKKLSNEMREKLLMKALVLSDEQIEKYGSFMREMPSSEPAELTKSDYDLLCREKIADSSDSFFWDSHGFCADISMRAPELVFFSVPYSEGWTAEVNGEPVDVEKVSYGFMAVKCDKGYNQITFRYRTPGLREGIFVSLGALAVLAAYVLIMRVIDKKRRYARFSHSYDYDSLEKVTASQIYTRSFFNKKIK